ncbi:MAG: hypothetical protein WC284_13895 [Candidimonas sp.]
MTRNENEKNRGFNFNFLCIFLCMIIVISVNSGGYTEVIFHHIPLFILSFIRWIGIVFAFLTCIGILLSYILYGNAEKYKRCIYNERSSYDRFISMMTVVLVSIILYLHGWTITAFTHMFVAIFCVSVIDSLRRHSIAK